MSSANATENSNENVARIHEQPRKPQSMSRVVIRRFLKHRMAVFGLVLLAFVVGYVTIGSLFYSVADSNKTSIRNRFEPPSAEFLLGTDEAGRDVLARTIYGGQISLMIGVLAVVISITLGTGVGLLAGFFGGGTDAILMRIVEALLAIPTLIMLLLLSRVLMDASQSTIVFFGREMSVTVVAIILIIGFTGWMSLSRIVRSQVLTLKEQEFVVAARSMGANNRRILLSHILPNCVAPILVAATLGVGTAIVIETALSFLGFGVLPPTATWGNILNRARLNIDDLWWLWMAPGALIMLTVLSINFIGDGLRDAFDPTGVD
jgi:peptide/nickel transport system permease protein